MKTILIAIGIIAILVASGISIIVNHEDLLNFSFNIHPTDIHMEKSEYYVPLGTDEEEFVLWVFTDPHVTSNPNWLEDAMEDAHDYFHGYDMAVCLGDLVTDVPQDLVDYRDMISVYGERNLYYELPGNHDVATWSYWDPYIDPTGQNPSTSWVNNSERPFPVSNATQTCYEIQIRNDTITSNLVILMMGVDINQSSPYVNIYDYYDWWKERIEAHPDDIVLTFTHHQLYYSDVATYSPSELRNMFVVENQTQASESKPYTPTNFAEYLNADGHEKACDLWAWGHMHRPACDWYGHPGYLSHDEDNMDDYEMNTTFCFFSSLYPDDQDCGSGSEGHSFLLTFTNGENTFHIGDFDHTHDEWDGYIGNRTEDLHHVYTVLSIESQTGFIDINEGINGTYIGTPTPTFNWSRISNCYVYKLQIANDSSFTDIIVNISNISIYEYPLFCSQTDTIVTFRLPDEYAVTEYKKYYCKVAGYVLQ